MANKFAIVTGASTGIGFHLAKLAAADGYDLLIVADEPLITTSADELRATGVDVQSVEADLATIEGNDQLLAATNGRPVDALFANAGRGLGRAFVDQDVADWKRVIDTNVLGTTYLLQKVAQQMKARNAGKILITGSIAGLMPGSFQAVYNGTKAYLDSFSYALREELKDTDITITVLMPGPTETEFFRRADMMDTKVGVQDKEDPAVTAKNGYDALMSGSAHVVSGLMNKVQATMSHFLPDGILASMHRGMAEPGTADKA
jgi:short-subunit dehydrogenase